MSADAFLVAGPIWMEPVAGGSDGHGLERSVRASAGFGPCRCGESLLIVDVGGRQRPMCHRDERRQRRAALADVHLGGGCGNRDRSEPPTCGPAM